MSHFEHPETCPHHTRLSKTLPRKRVDNITYKRLKKQRSFIAEHMNRPRIKSCFHGGKITVDTTGNARHMAHRCEDKFCPVCRRYHGERIRYTVAGIITRAQNAGHGVYLMTLNVPHAVGGALWLQRDQMRAWQAAQTKWLTKATMERYGIAGTYRVFEAPANLKTRVFNMHAHVLIVTTEPLTTCEQERLRLAWAKAWARCTRRFLEDSGTKDVERYMPRLDRQYLNVVTDSEMMAKYLSKGWTASGESKHGTYTLSGLIREAMDSPENRRVCLELLESWADVFRKRFNMTSATGICKVWSSELQKRFKQSLPYEDCPDHPVTLGDEYDLGEIAVVISYPDDQGEEVERSGVRYEMDEALKDTALGTLDVRVKHACTLLIQLGIPEDEILIDWKIPLDVVQHDCKPMISPDGTVNWGLDDEDQRLAQAA